MEQVTAGHVTGVEDEVGLGGGVQHRLIEAAPGAVGNVGVGQHHDPHRPSVDRIRLLRRGCLG